MLSEIENIGFGRGTYGVLRDGGGAEASWIGLVAFSVRRLYGDWRELAFHFVEGGQHLVSCMF